MSGSRICGLAGCSGRIEHFASMGIRACNMCGDVKESNMLAAEVGFNENSAGGVSLSGTMIGTSSTGLIMSKNGAMYQRNDSRELTISKGHYAVRDLARKLPDFPHRVTTRACRYFETAVNHGFTKGRTREHVAAACLFVSCRTPDRDEMREEKPAPFMLIDFSTVLKISVFDLGMIYLKLVNKLGLGKHICLQDPSLYIDRWARMLEFDTEDVHQIAEDACHLVMGFKRDWLSEGRRPSGICGAALLLAARMNNYHRTMHEIIQVVKVADVTIKKRLAEFKDTASSDLTIEQFRQAWTQGPDYWDSMAQSLPPAKMKNDAAEEAEQRYGKRKMKAEADSDISGEEEDSEREFSEDESDGDDDEEDSAPGMKALAAASKKLRQAQRKRRRIQEKKTREEVLKREHSTPSSSRAGSMLPNAGPDAPPERARTPVPMPNWKMDSVEPGYMAKAKEAASRPRRRRRSSAKGKRPVISADAADEEAETDKEEGGGELDTDEEEGDRAGGDEKTDDTDNLQRMDPEKEEETEGGDAESAADDLLEQHEDLVDNAIEKELDDALNASVDMDASGQKKITTMSTEINELAGRQRQRAQQAANSAKRDWADGLDEDELEAYIMDEAGFEAKKRIWWHNNYEYMIRRYERKQKEDGLAQTQQPTRGKRQRPGPAASAYEATMNMVKGKGFSSRLNYEAMKALHAENDDFSDSEEKLRPVTTRSAPARADGADSDKEEGVQDGAGTDKEEGTAAATDKEEGDEKADEDDKVDEEEEREEFYDDEDAPHITHEEEGEEYWS